MIDLIDHIKVKLGKYHKLSICRLVNHITYAFKIEIGDDLTHYEHLEYSI